MMQWSINEAFLWSITGLLKSVGILEIALVYTLIFVHGNGMHGLRYKGTVY